MCAWSYTPFDFCSLLLFCFWPTLLWLSRSRQRRGKISCSHRHLGKTETQLHISFWEYGGAFCNCRENAIRYATSPEVLDYFVESACRLGHVIYNKLVLPVFNACADSMCVCIGGERYKIYLKKKQTHLNLVFLSIFLTWFPFYLLLTFSSSFLSCLSTKTPSAGIVVSAAQVRAREWDG